MDPSPQEIGYCQNHGVGASLYNSLEVLGCSSNCLCFNQVAAETADVNCDTSKAVGEGVKMACFDKCLQDCNGNNCGESMEPDSSITRLQLTGQGQICTDPVADEDFVCETTNMIKDAEGNLVDDFTREDSGKRYHQRLDDTTGLDGNRCIRSHHCQINAQSLGEASVESTGLDPAWGLNICSSVL